MEFFGVFVGVSGRETELPVVVGEMDVTPLVQAYLMLRELSGGTNDESLAYNTNNLADVFSAAEDHRASIAQRIYVTTPDPFINAAVPALCVAADALWDDEQQCYMHGAVAWRTRLLGWRGPYAGDALGWHDRTAKHFASFAKQQNTSPIPDPLPPMNNPILHAARLPCIPTATSRKTITT